MEVRFVVWLEAHPNREEYSPLIIEDDDDKDSDVRPYDRYKRRLHELSEAFAASQNFSSLLRAIYDPVPQSEVHDGMSLGSLEDMSSQEEDVEVTTTLEASIIEQSVGEASGTADDPSVTLVAPPSVLTSPLVNRRRRTSSPIEQRPKRQNRGTLPARYEGSQIF